MKIGRFIKKFWNTLESYDGLTKIIFKNKIHYKLWDGTWDLTSLVLKKTIDSDFDRNYKNYLDKELKFYEFRTNHLIRFLRVQCL